MKGMDIGPTTYTGAFANRYAGTMDMGNDARYADEPNAIPVATAIACTAAARWTTEQHAGYANATASPSPATQKHDMHNMPADENMGNMR